MPKSRAKGKRTELELASLLKATLSDSSIKRNLAQTADGGVDLTGRSLRYMAVEAKSAEVPRWSEWLAQAAEQAQESQFPVLARRQAGGTWTFIVQMDLLQFDKFVRLWNTLTDGKHV